MILRYTFTDNDILMHEYSISFDRKKKSTAKRIFSFAQKFNWLAVVVLIVFALQLHYHKRALRNEVDEHKEHKDNLLQRVQELDTSVAQKARELNEVQRLHGQAAQSANQASDGKWCKFYTAENRCHFGTKGRGHHHSRRTDMFFLSFF